MLREVPNRYTVADACLWVGSFAAMTARVMVLQPLPDAWEITGRRALVTLAGFLFCELLLPALRRLRRAPLVLQGLAGLVMAVVGSLWYGLVNHLVMYSVAPRLPTPDYSDVLFVASLQVYVFFAWGAIVVALGYAEEAQETALKLLSAEKLAAESQASMLRYQLNPHFLFNTLNALSALILERQTARAEQVVLSLSRFLRHALRRDAAALIPLSEELEAQRQYLAIEQIRFSDRLVYTEHATRAARTARVPSFILQPLVENAVKYGVAPATRPVSIAIRAAEQDGRVIISVEDDGPASDAACGPRLGVGLENVRARLELNYPSVGRLRLERLDPGFRATIELPFEGGA